METALTSPRVAWLRRVLLFKVALCFLLWGLPALIGPAWFLALFGLTMPDDPLFLRLFGSMVIAFGVAYWCAYQDPVRNRAILVAGVVDNGMATLTIVGVALTTGVFSWFLWLSAALTAFFCVAFLTLMLRE